MRNILILSLVFSTLLLTGCFRTRSEIEGEQSQSQMRESFASGLQQINELQAQMGQVQGRLDEIDHNRRKDAGRTGESQQELGNRVQALSARVEELQKAQNALFEEVKKMREEGPAPMPIKHSATPVKPANAFAAAQALYQKKQYAEAAIAFGAIYEASPKSENGRKAALRVAESFKKLGKEKETKIYAQLVIDSAPKSAEAKKARKLLQ